MEIIRNVDLDSLTTFALPGSAAALARWSNADDLASLGDMDLPQPIMPLGGGSNLLFTKPFEGTLLQCAIEPEARFDGLTVTAPVSMTLDSLCAQTCSLGLRGMENLSGIPGSLGGAIVQNAGAYGAETTDRLTSVTLFDLQQRQLFTATRQWLAPAYRHTRLKAEPGRYVVVNATFTLLPGSASAQLDYGNLRDTLQQADPTPEAVRQAILQIRSQKLPDPAQTGSAGSFFRNPEVAVPPTGAPAYPLENGLYKVPAAWLIDQCGLKGQRIGGAVVWPHQPLIIANDSEATAADVLALEDLIVQTVRQRFGITLTPEVEHV